MTNLFKTISCKASILSTLLIVGLSTVSARAEESIPVSQSIASGDMSADAGDLSAIVIRRAANATVFPRMKKPTKNTLGVYTGTFILQSSRSFNRVNCTPTQSFPAAIAITGKVKKPNGQIGNLPFSLKGTADSSGANLSGSFKQDPLSRSYTLAIRKVKATSAQLTLTEVVKSGGKKACQFVHKAEFQRT